MKYALLIPIIAITSCASITERITGIPTPTTPVKRANVADAPEFKVATQDVYRAEANPNRTYGLYDLATLSEIIGNSSK